MSDYDKLVEVLEWIAAQFCEEPGGTWTAPTISQVCERATEALPLARQLIEEQQRDYDGMREFQAKFIAADQELRSLRENERLKKRVEGIDARISEKDWWLAKLRQEIGDLLAEVKSFRARLSTAEEELERCGNMNRERFAENAKLREENERLKRGQSWFLQARYADEKIADLQARLSVAEKEVNVVMERCLRAEAVVEAAKSMDGWYDETNHTHWEFKKTLRRYEEGK